MASRLQSCSAVQTGSKRVCYAVEVILLPKLLLGQELVTIATSKKLMTYRTQIVVTLDDEVCDLLQAQDSLWIKDCVKVSICGCKVQKVLVVEMLGHCEMYVEG
jgi:hypothetical protein